MYATAPVPTVRAAMLGAVLLAVTFSGCFGQNDHGSPYDYVRDSKYDTWVIEIDYVQGHQPSADVLSTLRSRMGELVHKDTITTDLDDQIEGRSVWSRGDIDALRDRHGDQRTRGSTAVTHLVFVDGRYEKETTLGVAVGHDFVVIFSERIATACSSDVLCFPADEVQVRKAVLVHEFGHIIGLVDNGVPMVNSHGDGTAHSTNQNSVMYATADTTGIFGLNNIPTTFDSNDKLDICRAGGKGSC